MENIKISVEDPAVSDFHLVSDETFEKVEFVTLKRTLYPEYSPYIEITMAEYDKIKEKIQTKSVMIPVTGYYGVPSYYSVMPQAVFDALETANLNGNEFALVDKEQFDKMIENYKMKMNIK